MGFLGFFKLNFLYGLTLGQLAGVAFLAASIGGWPVNLNLGDWHIAGVPAGIGALIVLPPVGGIVFLVTAPVVFLPFAVATRVFGGFKNS